jgi:putative transcriptional regulator
MMARRTSGDGTPQEPGHRIRLKLDEVLASRAMTLAELSRQVGVSQVNLSVLKNGHARAIRFSTLTAICDALGCTPGDLLEVAPPE